MQLLALTRGPVAPSARFRFRQYLPALQAAGIEATERYAPAGATAPPGGLATRLTWLTHTLPRVAASALVARRSDAVLLQKPLLTNRRTLEGLLRPGYAFDVDDATWLRSPAGIAAIARRAGVVIAGNDYIAEHFVEFAPTVVLPTGVDTERWLPRDTPVRDGAAPTVVWSGGHTGFADLALAAPALVLLTQRRRDLRLRILADLPPPASLGLPTAAVEYIPWSPEREVAAINTATVGIMPLRDSAWSRGKGAYKMLLYLSCGVPAVASPVGMNRVVATAATGAVTLATTTDEWVDALAAQLTDPAAAHRAGLAGRDAIAGDYSVATVGPRLAGVLKSLPRGA